MYRLINLTIIFLCITGVSGCSTVVDESALADGSDAIRGGTDAGPNEFPYFVQFVLAGYKEVTPLCGGVLIDPRHALTAAHCFDMMRYDGSLNLDKIKRDIMAVLGVQTRAEAVNFSGSANVLPLGIEHVYIPESYRVIGVGQQEYHFHDLALVRLRPLAHGKPPIAWGAVNPTAPLTYAGLGWQADPKSEQLRQHFGEWIRGDYHVIPQYPAQLQKATSQILTGPDCDGARTPPDTNLLDTSRLCMDVSVSSPDYGDSGGPVIQIVDGTPRLVGILQGSAGQFTGLGGVGTRTFTLGLAINVEAYRDWITLTLVHSYQGR
ncbi:MAG: trypsin-like serine protease [Myxococcales bacterium]|nr:trypsin-like serine protease [Myxococcales bacterium]